MQISFPPANSVLNTAPFSIFRDLNSDAAFANVQKGSDITDVLALAWQATTAEDRKRFAAASGQVAPGIYDTEIVFPETPNTGGQPGYLRYSLSNDKRMRQFALPTCSNKNITDLMADEWRSLTSAQKAKFAA